MASEEAKCKDARIFPQAAMEPFWAFICLAYLMKDGAVHIVVEGKAD